MLIRRTAVAILFLGLMMQAAAAEDLGPAIGTNAPDIGTPLDQSGRPRTLASLMGGNGVLLVFFRSVVW